VRIGVLTGSESLGWNAINVGQKTYTEFWNYKEDSKQQVTTFTNAEEVELIINGKWVNGKMVNGENLGRQKNDTTDVFKRGIIKWNNVPYGKGGSLTAIAYNNGKEVARHRIETAGKAVRLVIEPESPSLQGKDGMGLRYLTVRAVDKRGNTVPSFDEPLTININGTGYTLQSLDNGDHYTDDLFGPSVTTKRMYQGQMLIILRSTRQGGKTTISVTTPSLKAKTEIKQK
jgi:beta-galactosidase